MRLAPDTNVLVRVVMNDDAAQAGMARRSLADADAIYFTLPALCETAWVLRKFYGASREEIALAIRALTGASNAVFDVEAVSAGLGLLETGGDFADGVIAAAGIGMGAEAFLTFDKAAAKRLAEAGLAVRHPL
ncbi:MAG: type II toxin-antitoxin system VapC family toxin [Brevundimonas sp.]|uniref:type II toxin-antitoxin system VapC family toxin n=1 Tax=Brevundimonas sp. TaxID=1871086 RepID=UPI002733F917|nr:type II toxin-antitoxin system VapC family toxin [Brevundimonas sp.]MDP3405332.1 type II toxin-antitoxin system VapC family toxin [Brevundimonas sp.]